MPSELQNTQRDILTLDLSSNPYFRESPVPTKNNLLKTASKRIVGALNEIFDSVINVKDSVTNLSESTKDNLNTVNKKINDNTTNINESIEALKKNIGEGTIGGNSKMEVINLGIFNLVSDYSSLYNCVTYIPIPDEIKVKIDFNKPARVQIFKNNSGGYKKDFETLLFDSIYFNFAELNPQFNSGYTKDKTSVAIFSKTAYQNVRVNLVLE